VYGPASPAARSTGVPAAGPGALAELGALAAEARAPVTALEPLVAAPVGAGVPACPDAPPPGVVTGAVLVPPGGRPGVPPTGGEGTLGEDPPTDTPTSGAPEEDPPTDTSTGGTSPEDDPPTDTPTSDPSDEDSVAAGADEDEDEDEDDPPSETSTSDPLPDDPVDVDPPPSSETSTSGTPPVDTADDPNSGAARAVARPVVSSAAHRQAQRTSTLAPTPLDSRVVMVTT
jgi:hypothetical protein